MNIELYDKGFVEEFIKLDVVSLFWILEIKYLNFPEEIATEQAAKFIDEKNSEQNSTEKQKKC